MVATNNLIAFLYILACRKHCWTNNFKGYYIFISRMPSLKDDGPTNPEFLKFFSKYENIEL